MGGKKEYSKAEMFTEVVRILRGDIHERYPKKVLHNCREDKVVAIRSIWDGELGIALLVDLKGLKSDKNELVGDEDPTNSTPR